jgi:alcohol dehydrogenase class IV
MTEPRLLTFDALRQRTPEHTVVWAIPEVRALVEGALPFPLRLPLEPLPPQVQTLIVVGGGTLMDEAKVWRFEQAPGVELIVIPSIWGSGAEVSPIAVRNQDGKKEIRINPKLLPDARLVWPELAAAIPPDRVRLACGDCWAHALEGFLSPVATPALRAELAGLIGQMLATPMDNDPVWFELGARACAGQAQSSVGLVHGIAHTLEGFLRARHPDADWGHAKLCSLFLWPVMRFNEQASGKWQQLLSEHSLPPRAIMEVLRTLFDNEAYAQALPVLKEQWLSVLRDPCSRTNSALVRPASLDFFVRQQFL